MLAAVHSAAVIGVEAHPVLVEVDVARGLPAWSIVGLASNAVKEARERVSSALVNAGFEVPARRTTVNLSPDNCTKHSQYVVMPGFLTRCELWTLAPSRLWAAGCAASLAIRVRLPREGKLKSQARAPESGKANDQHNVGGL